MSASKAADSAAPVALVTGAARRIGRSIATELHGAGFTIALHYRQSGDAARELAEQLCARRPESCRSFQADLESPAQIRTLAHEVNTYFGQGLQLLVNNASSFYATPLEHCSETEFDALLNANLKGPYFLIQALLPALRLAGGNIVNIIDTHARRPLRDFNVYGASKAGLAALTRSLALELGPDIRVNGVAPGAILWPENAGSYDDSERTQTLERTPLKRLGDPTDIARAVRFLACEAPFVTGQIIEVDGGRGLAG